MPKEGLSKKEWETRFYKFANGEFTFHRGQKPPPNSIWSRLLKKIELCPRHRSMTGKDLFGNEVKCDCGFHNPQNKVPTVNKRFQHSTHTLTKPPSTISSPSATSTISTQSPVSCVSSPVLSNQGPPQATTEPTSTVSPSVQTSIATSTSALASTQTTDFTKRLPSHWQKHMNYADQVWIGKYLFSSGPRGQGGVLVSPIRFWNHPPPVFNPISNKPNPGNYFKRRIFLWMPRRMFKYDFKCCREGCTLSLNSHGIYPKFRPVLDVSDFYYMATEYFHCPCGFTAPAWDSRIVSQLPYGMQVKFPALLTYKYACDKSLITLLKSRTLGNSPNALQNTLLELHSERWLQKNIEYLYDCQRHKHKLQLTGVRSVNYSKAEVFRDLPNRQWFLAAYARDVWTRLDTLKAAITSVFGRILKIDSTKKILRKLAGEAKGSASWVTNVGNEYGGILQCLLTSSEAVEALQPMADGLVSRYESAKVTPPIILYTDRDCCSYSGPSKFQQLFSAWPHLTIRLDIWHFMRRIACGCTSESHPLYSVFMSQLSGCIFEWDMEDFEKLLTAKCSELKGQGVRSPSRKAVQKALGRKEIARHCKRRTRGYFENLKLLEQLILSFTGATDSLGVPLLKSEMVDIWNEQKRHVSCIQDPAGTQLYSKTGSLMKGGVELPVYRCWRGSTSLESFHNHLPNFIPGNSANAVNFQAYLLDGLCRWNTQRKDDVEKTMAPLKSFNVELVSRFKEMHLSIHGDQFTEHKTPSPYTGELIGMEYLFQQINVSLTEEYVEKHLDDGVEGEDQDGYDSGVDDEEVGLPFEDDDDNEDEDDLEEQDSLDSKGVPGWHKVGKLAKALLGLDGVSLTNAEVNCITDLYDKLDDFDKRPLVYQSIIKGKTRGRFGARKREGHVRLAAMKKCFLSGGSPALMPSKSRLVEAICIHLCNDITSNRTVPRSDGTRRNLSRWKQIIQEYNDIRGRLFNSNLLETTNLTLFTINETTLRKWHQDKTRCEEVLTLMQGRDPPGKLTVAQEPLPPAISPSEIHGCTAPLKFDEPEDRSGKARMKIRQVQRSEITTEVNPSNVEEDFTIQFPPELSPEKPTGNSSFAPSISTETVTVSKPSRKRTRSEPKTSKQKPTTQTQAFIQPTPLMHPFQSLQSFQQYRPFQPYQPMMVYPGSGFQPPLMPMSPLSPPLSPFSFSPLHSPPAVQDQKKERKIYSCRKCGQPMKSANHGQYKGQRYCGNEPGALPYKEWLKKQHKDS